MATDLKKSTNFVVAFDLGSNTIRGIKLDCRGFKKIAEYEKIIKTADRLVETKKISKEAVGRLLNALKEAKEVLGIDNNVLVKAVATEALRRAKNSKEILELIEQESQIKFEIIDGEQEARLSLLAVSNRLRELKKEEGFILLDIGGGSSELVFNSKEQIVSKSFPLGIVTLSQEANSLKDIKRVLEAKLEPIREFIDKNRAKFKDISLFVATAGTPTTLASLKVGLDYESYNSKYINGVTLKLEELDFYLDKLLKMSKQERAKAVGVGREDLIIAGILIFKEIFKLLGFKEVIVIDDGLREGLAIKSCKEGF